MKRRDFLKGLSLVGAGSLAGTLGAAGCNRDFGLLRGKTMYKRVIVIGIDGIDPSLVDRYMADGDLPAFSHIATAGSYARLGTSNPPQSPVAWSDIGTGTDAGTHGVFDFIVRDPKKYLPDLGMLRYNRQNIFGTREKMFLPTCNSKFFWDYTAQAGIPSVSIRWPMTFPPAQSNAQVLAGLGVPDIRGGLGRYSLLTTRSPEAFPLAMDKVTPLVPDGDRLTAHIPGPDVQGLSGKKTITTPIVVARSSADRIRITAGSGEFELSPRQWSPWIRFEFPGGPRKKIFGIGRLFAISTENDVDLYLTPLQVDPDNPCFVISNPDLTNGYATELIDAVGDVYHTLGIPEDTKPVTEHVIDDDAFISQCDDIMAEREKMLSYGLDHFTEGLFSLVIDTTDRIQHMFYRFEDPEHPLYSEEGKKKYGNVMRDYYRRVDGLIGDITQHHVDDETLLLVCSDHGFSPFRKGVNLNRWLIDQGLMTLSSDPDPTDIEGGALFRHVDWKNTMVYSVGFSSIYLNLSGREGQGVVNPSDAAGLKQKIMEKLVEMKDPQTGSRIVKNVYDSKTIYSPERIMDAPDLVIGFDAGYRMSWQTAIGGTPIALVEPNDKEWSGDHIVDPSLVPGIFFSNASLKKTAPTGLDIAPTVLSAFGIKPGEKMTGDPLF
ncbi:MAG: alkaline phosphatase family protein [Deltaproteobacteria bacterium]|nr:alkaline phosphatase family protein [Candidatus Zymogenaceae bacterium]